METRRIEMQWGTCEFFLKRSARRSVGFQIGDEGLVISAPMRVPELELERIILSKSRWIRTRLDQWQTRKEVSAPLSEWFEKTSTVPVEGEPYQLDYIGTISAPKRSIAPKTWLNPWTKTITLPNANKPQALNLLEKILKQHALSRFQELARKLSGQGSGQSPHGSTPALELPRYTIKLSSPVARWGSCNSEGEIRINWRLIHHPTHHIEYVIAHELAHLLEMNHSERFWKIVSTLMPDYKLAHQALSKLNPAEVPR